MRVVAIIASYNERRFIGPCLEHLHAQGVASYLIDNGSTDATVEIAERYLDRGLIGIEELPRGNVYDWRGLLRRKEEVAEELTREREADWLIHLDPDEVRLAPPGEGTLAEALTTVDRAGYNAVNFLECTFVPSREEPDHDHPDFQRTLRTYYAFCPSFPHQLKAWKAADAPQPRLAASGGHRVAFRGLRMHPNSFPMKHYLFLSVPHAVEKYVKRRYDAEEVRGGWHGWRAGLHTEQIRLPGRSELRVAEPDGELDLSRPRQRHDLAIISAAPAALPGFHVTRPEPREEMPDGDALGSVKVVHRGAGRRAEIALTFDDGPSAWTAAVAAAFERHDCRATFFLRGAAVAELPAAVASLVAAGHELGNHLWSHTNASGQSRAELRAEIDRTADAIEAAGAPRPTLIRPPYFSAPEAVAKAAAGSGATAVVLRSIGSSDWEATSAEQIVGPVLANARAGDIVCLHDGISSDKREGDSRQPTVEAVAELVPALLERGLRPVTVSQLLTS